MKKKYNKKHLAQKDVDALKQYHKDLEEVSEKTRPFDSVFKMKGCRYPRLLEEGQQRCGFKTESTLALNFHRMFPHRDIKDRVRKIEAETRTQTARQTQR